MAGERGIDILLVEDNPDHAQFTLKVLSTDKGVGRTFWVKDGQQALDYIFRQGDYAEREHFRPRLILLDLKMPRVDGIEVLKAIRADENTKRIPVVIMTSSQEESDVVSSYDLGVNSYIVKPIDFSSLTEIARRAGFYWLAVNRPAQR